MGRLKPEPLLNTVPTSYENDNLSEHSLKHIHSELENSISSFTKRVSVGSEIPKLHFENSWSKDVLKTGAREALNIPCKDSGHDYVETFDKQRFLNVIERLKEESNV